MALGDNNYSSNYDNNQALFWRRPKVIILNHITSVPPVILFFPMYPL